MWQPRQLRPLGLVSAGGTLAGAGVQESVWQQEMLVLVFIPFPKFAETKPALHWLGVAQPLTMVWVFSPVSVNSVRTTPQEVCPAVQVCRSPLQLVPSPLQTSHCRQAPVARRAARVQTARKDFMVMWQQLIHPGVFGGFFAEGQNSLGASG